MKDRISPRGSLAVLVFALLFLDSPSAHAATSVYADAGGCNGLTPCYGTIQEAVDNAGGGASTVYVFPGTWDESVDISLMGSSDGAQADLTFQAVDASGSPTVGGVTVSPAAGEAFFNSVDPFPFSLAIHGINVSSGSTDAIDIEGLSGDILITDMNATGATFDGIDIRSGGSIELRRVHADANGNDGIQIRTVNTGDVTIAHSTANGNGLGGDSDGDGILIELRDGSIFLQNVEASSNEDDGIRINPWSNYTLVPGPDAGLLIVELASIDFGAIDRIEAVDVTTNGNGDADDDDRGQGFVTRAFKHISWFNGDVNDSIDLYGTVGDTEIYFSESSNNTGGGFILEATTDGDVTIADARANGNAEEGFEINPPDTWSRPSPADPSPSQTSPYNTVYLHHLRMQRCEAIGNGADGFQMEPSFEESDVLADIESWMEYITLADIASRNNGHGGFGEGVELAASEAIVLDRIASTGNLSDGIQIAGGDPDEFTNYAPWTVTARDIVATGNGSSAGDNIEVDARGDITFQVVDASDKAGGSGDGIELTTWVDGDILLEDCRAENNPNDDGIDVNAAGSLTIRRCEASGNAADGIDTAKTQPDTGELDDYNPNRNLNSLIEDVIVEMNGDDGIQTYAESSTTIQRACVRQNADAGIFVMGTDGNLAITDCVSENNTADGICLRNLSGGSYTMGGTNVAGNTPGLRNLFAGTTSATGNWWGAASGPTHPDNPGGTGDAILDGDNGAQGTVNFSPVLGAPAAGPVNCESVIQETPDEPAQALANPRLQVRVDKVFDDGNPGEVTVRLACNTGLPLEQNKTISEGDGVVFIVEEFDPGELDCIVTEDPVPGYLPTYTATVPGPLVAGSASGPNDQACAFDDIQSGEVVCTIENALQPATFTVTKEWVINNPQPNEPTDATASWTCSGQADVDGVVNQGGLSFSGMVATDTFAVYPHWDGGTTCTVDEVNVDDTTEVDDGNCAAVPVLPGAEPACTLVNTRFYEGIPALGGQGRWLLVLLLAGMAAWVMRRPA